MCMSVRVGAGGGYAYVRGGMCVSTIHIAPLPRPQRSVQKLSTPEERM